MSTKKSIKKNDLIYEYYDEFDNLICTFKYKHINLKLIIDFYNEEAEVLNIDDNVNKSRNLQFQVKHKLIKTLSKNDIKLDEVSYLKCIKIN